MTYYGLNGGGLNSRTLLHRDDLLTWALFIYHSASFSPSRYASLSLFWPLVHRSAPTSMEWGRKEVIVPVVKVLFKSLGVIFKCQRPVRRQKIRPCAPRSSRQVAVIQLSLRFFSQRECEGQKLFCLFNANSTAKTHPHSHACAHMHRWQAPSASLSFPGEDQLSDSHHRGNQPNLTALWRHPAHKRA